MRRFARSAGVVAGIAMLFGVTSGGAHEEEVVAAGTSGETATLIHPPDDDRSPASCGWFDTPETGIQGDVPLADQQSGRAQQGYNCGLAVVGYNNLGGATGSDVTGIDHCAYVKSTGGIRVVDVSDPTAPVVVTTLPLTVTSENIYALEAPDRSLLVAGGAPSAPGQPIPAYVWDVEDCTNPVLLGTVGFPGPEPREPGGPEPDPQHRADPRRQEDLRIAAAAGGGHQQPCRSLHVDGAALPVRSRRAGPARLPRIPVLSARFALDFPECANLLAHEFEFNKAGTRMYIGGQMSGTTGR